MTSPATIGSSQPLGARVTIICVSGVVVERAPEGPRTSQAFLVATRVAFETLRARLQALGADFADVVMINSFHDWSAPELGGNRQAQFDAFRKVKEEFMTAPHPAWTAVGTSGLIRERGIVEVQMIAYSPPAQFNRYVRRETCILDRSAVSGRPQPSSTIEGLSIAAFQPAPHWI